MTSNKNEFSYKLFPNGDLIEIDNNELFINNSFLPNNFNYQRRQFDNACYYHNYQIYSFPFHENMVEETKQTKQNNIEVINQREALICQLSTFQLECTICLIAFQPENPTWSCENCYNIFHLSCIKKWIKSSINDTAISWHCPTCKKKYSLPENDINYTCFCGKVINPTYKRGSLMHSCEDTCSRKNKNNDRCPHLCSIKCHPGPCPPCEASIISKCHCSKTSMTVKCEGSEYFLVCGSKCERLLNCSIHFCQENCHIGDCNTCNKTFVQQCNCSTETRTVVCGSSESKNNFKCNKICGKMKDCKIHECQKQCHMGSCDSCCFLPENIKFCQCGQTSLEDLVKSNFGNYVERQTCLDPIPICDKKCNKSYLYCEHKCIYQCHEGPCPPCLLSSSVRCCCVKTNQTVKCSEFLQLKSEGKLVKCNNRCKSKKICGNHRCNEICCDMEVHVCEVTCGKQLSCKQHFCEKLCHQGKCPTCSNITFDELYCECGITRSLPPIACGQPLPICEEICSRNHHCNHVVLHQCHNEENCPPCVVPTNKICSGGHNNSLNVPCFQSIISCGLQCHKKLPNCDHYCLKICHSEDCTKDSQCVQPCIKIRPDCLHPCNASCHIDDCKYVMKPCRKLIEVKCICGVKSSSMVCSKYQQLNKSMMPNISKKTKDGLDLLLSEDNSVNLKCDLDCKKAARLKQSQQCSEIFYENSYSGFLRDFSIKDPTFLVKVDKVFITLMKKLETEKLAKVCHKFEPMNKEKIIFIQKLSEYFGLKFELESNKIVKVEAVKGISKIPPKRLLQFMQQNYPNLFKSDKTMPMKYIPQHQINFSKYS